jgi:CelD/BcsL family acetyltransferase involved in cellulose biosynthesis
MVTPPSSDAPAASAETVALPMMVGARTVFRLRRRLVRIPLPLREVLSGRLPDLPPLPADADGFLINSLPAGLLALIDDREPGLRAVVRQRYRRAYATLDGGFDRYLAGFSAKSRSTLRRKVRRFAERSGGRLDLRCYAAAGELDAFYREARAVSAKTYQERLLDAGLPRGEGALAAMRSLAERNLMRGWVLFLDGQPVSYLYAPAEGDTLIYSHLGYDPAFADLSPGTVLQFEAMRQLTGEGRFALFDFTEGEGQHKLLFATGTAECVDLLLLRPTLANALAGRTLNAFDAAVSSAKGLVGILGLERLARRIRR